MYAEEKNNNYYIKAIIIEIEFLIRNKESYSSKIMITQSIF